MQIEKNDGVEECEVIEFSLKANNRLAGSPAGTATGGFPIGESHELALQVLFDGQFLLRSTSGPLTI